jgi:excisionase family DNA binding protein
MERVAFSIREAAEQLGLHPATVRRLVSAASIRAVRIGFSQRIPTAEIERLLRTDAPVVQAQA